MKSPHFTCIRLIALPWAICNFTWGQADGSLHQTAQRFAVVFTLYKQPAAGSHLQAAEECMRLWKSGFISRFALPTMNKTLVQRLTTRMVFLSNGIHLFGSQILHSN